MGSSSRANTASQVALRPSRRALARTCLARSGRALALPARLLRANSTDMRSVPAEISDARVRTRTWPAVTLGAGTSRTASLPVRGLWMTCFMAPFVP